MRKIKSFTIILLIFSQLATAQTSVSHQVKIIAHPILELSFDKSAQDVVFNFSNISDYENGKSSPSVAGIKVKSNKNWIVNVRSNSSTFTPNTNGDTNIFSTALLVKKSGTNQDIPVTTNDQVVATGKNGDFNLNSFLLDYTINPGFIKPDAYGIELTYTLTTP